MNVGIRPTNQWRQLLYNCSQVKRLGIVHIFYGSPIVEEYYSIAIREFLDRNICLFVINEIDDFIQKCP